MSKENITLLHTLIEQSPIAIQIMTPDGRIVKVNHAYKKLWGISLHELSEYNIFQDEQAKSLGLMPYIKRGFAGETLSLPPFEYDPVKTKVVQKGGKRWIQSLMYPVKDENGEIQNVVMMHEDITERVQYDERTKHLNLVLRAIRKVSQLITREKDRDELLKGACENLVENRGYYNAWITVLDESGGLVTSAEAGLGKAFTPMIKQLKRGKMTACGQKALSQPGVVVTEDPLSACADCPLSSKYHGRSAMTVRLEYGGKVQGLASVSIPAHFATDEEEQTLFSELTTDIAFALHSLELEEKRKQAEEALTESEQRFRAIFDNATDGILLADMENRKFYTGNKTIFQMLGYNPEESRKLGVMDIHPQQDLPHVFEEFEKLSKGEHTLARDIPVQRKDGSVFYADINSSPVELAGKTYLIGIFRDITERKQAEEALRKKEETIRALVETSQDWIWSIDVQGIHTYSNPAIEKILGYTTDELIGRSSLELMHDEDRQVVEAKLPQWIKEKCGWKSLILRWRHKDGSWCWLESKAAPIFDAAGELIGFRGVDRDITERKRAEEALRTSEAQLSNAMEIAKLGYWEYDVAEDIFTFNDHFYDIFRTTAEKVGGYKMSSEQYARQFIHPDDISVVDIETRKAIETTDPNFSRQLEHRIIYADGEIGYISVRFFIVKDSHGRTVKTYGANQDITERKRTEKAVAEWVKELNCLHQVARLVETPDVSPEDIFQGTVDLIPQAYHYPELTCACITLSGREYKTEGFRETEWKQHADIVVRGENAGRVRVCLLKMPADKEIPFFPEEQQLLETLAERLSRVTERMLAEADRMRLMLAIGQAGEAIVITDTEGTIEYVNPAFEKTTGYTREEAIGQNPRILKSGEQDDKFYRKMWEKLTRGETWRGRLVNKKKDGAIYTEETVISPVRDETGQTVNYVAVKRDITHELYLEAQLSQAQKMEAVGRLAGGVAHDFNNMLSVILGNTDMILEQMDPTQPYHADLEEIKKAGQRSADLTRQLLAFARKQTVVPKVIDLNKTVAGMTRMLERLIGEDIDLAWVPGEALWPLKIDPGQIDQILANLCVNARDAITDVGKVTIETGNTTFDEAYCDDHVGFVPGEYVMLAVSDDGCGMNSETLDNVFEPFFTTKEPGKGTGLGLATVYGVVKQNQGFINIYSEPGQGTTFRIYLPRHLAKEAALPDKGPDTPTKRGHETILLVEDQPSILKMSTRMLEGEGYTVVAAGTPGEAMRLANEHAGDIHLLMTDVVMPEMNGRDLAKNILSLYPHLKCLFMSGYMSNVIAHHGVLDEGVHFIPKPFSRDDLTVKVREVLDRD